MAVRISGVSLKVEGAEKFASDLDKARSAMKQNEAEMKLLDATYKGAEGSEYYEKRQEKLGKQLEQQRKRTETLRQARVAYAAQEGATAEGLEKLDLAITRSMTEEKKLEHGIRECADAMAEQAASAKGAANAADHLGDETRKAGDEIKAAEEKAKAFEKRLDSIEKVSGKVGSALTKGLTVPIIGMGTAALKFSTDFEDALWETATMPGTVTGTLEEQRRQLEEMGDELLAASDRTHVAATELAAGQYLALSSGVSQDDSAYWAERAAMAAKAGQSDVETVIDGASSVENAWGKTAGGLDHILDAMITAQNLGKTTVGQIASQIGQVTGLAPQLNIAFDEIMAATAALTANGLSTSSSITGLRGVMSAVIKPTSEAAETAKTLGLDFSAAAVQAKGFTGWLQDVMEKTGGSTEHLGKLFGQVEGLNAIMMLGTSANKLYTDSLTEIRTAEGVLDEAFAIRISSRAEQLNGGLNRMKNAGIELAENLYPAVDAIADLLDGVAEYAGAMTEEQQRTALMFTGVAAAIGPVATGVSKLIGLYKTLSAVSIGPWGWATMAVAAIGGGLYAVNELALGQAEQLREAFSDFDIGYDAGEVEATMNRIQADIDAWTSSHHLTANGTIVPNVDKAQLNKDLTSAVDAAFADMDVSSTEYALIIARLGEVSDEAREAARSDNAEVAAVAAALQGAVDDYNTLLATVYREGNTATEAELNALDAALARVTELRAQLFGLTQSTEDVETQTYRSWYNMALMGVGGEDARAGGAVYVVGYNDMRNSAAQKAVAEAVARGQEELIAAEQSGAGKEELEVIEVRNAEERATLEAKAEEIAREGAELAASYVEGLLGLDPGTAAELTAGGDLIEALNAGKKAYGGTPEDQREWLTRYVTAGGLRAAGYDTTLLQANGQTLGQIAESGNWAVLDDNFIASIVRSIRKQMLDELNEWEAGFDTASLDGVHGVIEQLVAGGDIQSADADGLLADYLRVLEVVKNGIDAIGTDAMNEIGSAAESAVEAAAEGAAHSLQVPATREALEEMMPSPEEAQEQGQGYGQAYGLGIGEGLGGASVPLEETAGGVADGLLKHLVPIGSQRDLGIMAARTLRMGLLAGQSDAVDAAASLAAAVNAQLATIQFTGSLGYPGAGLGVMDRGYGGSTASNYDFSTNVTVARVDATDPTAMSAFAERMAALNRAKQTAHGING